MMPPLNSYTLSLENVSGISKRSVWYSCTVTYQAHTLTSVAVIFGFLWNCLLRLRQTRIGFVH